MNAQSDQVPKHLNLPQLSDAELLSLTRSGRSDAFGELWSRHQGAVIAATRSFTRYEPEDLAQEAFARVYASVMRGGELPASFRAYVASTSRRIAIDRSAKEKGMTFGDWEECTELVIGPYVDHADAVLERKATAEAFAALPSRQREVLWYRDVEDLPVKEVALYLGLSENATSALLKRAREALKDSWVEMQLVSPRGQKADCVEVVPKLGKFSRGSLSPRSSRAVEAHLVECEHCAALAVEADLLRRRLALVLLPMFLLGGAPSYLEWIESKHNRALPSSQASLLNNSLRGLNSDEVVTARAGQPGARWAKPSLAVAAGVLGILVLGTSASLTIGSRESYPKKPVMPTHVAEAAQHWGKSDSDQDVSRPFQSPPAATAETTASSGRDPGSSSDIGAAVLPVSAVPSVTPSPMPVSADLPVDPPLPTPVVYPEYRELSTMSADSPFRFWISATPFSTVELVIQEAAKPDFVVSLAIPSSGEVMYGFPDHRGRVVAFSLTQDYETVSGTVRSEALTFVDYSIPVT